MNTIKRFSISVKFLRKIAKIIGLCVMAQVDTRLNCLTCPHYDLPGGCFFSDVTHPTKDCMKDAVIYRDLKHIESLEVAEDIIIRFINNVAIENGVTTLRVPITLSKMFKDRRYKLGLRQSVNITFDVTENQVTIINVEWHRCRSNRGLMLRYLKRGDLFH